MKESSSGKTSEKKLQGYEHAIAGWSLILVFIGGAIGGLFGGLAYAANTKILGSELSNPHKYTYCFLVGVGAFALYFSIAYFISTML